MAKTKTLRYGGINLPMINHTGASVPTEALKITLPVADKKALAIAVKNNIPALLIGETGTGKTSAIKEIAFLRKQKYTRISLTGYTTPDELIGSKSVKDGATYYENGILTKAMIEGHIVVLDELNAITPDTSFVIHSLLDDEHKISLPNGDIITPDKDFRVFATINPDYEGTKSLNRAFLDRFGILIFIEILKPALEIKLLQDRTGISKTIATKLVVTAWLNRKAYTEGKTLTLISTRSLLQTGFLLSEGLKPAEAYKTAIVNKAKTDEHRAFMDFYNMIFKTNEGLGATLPQILTPDEVKQNEANLQKLVKERDDSRREAYDTQNKLAKIEDKLKVIEKTQKLTGLKLQPVKDLIKHNAFYSGQSFAGYIMNDFVIGKVQVEGGQVYLCQNSHNGNSASNKHGYKSSWLLLNSGEDYVTGTNSVTQLQLQEKPKKTEGTAKVRKNE